VDEQVEEEENASGIVGQLRRIGNSREGLFGLDRELGKRV
jgi:ferritin